MVDYDEEGRVHVEGLAARTRAGASDRRLGDMWWGFLLRGLFATALGLFALFWPTLSVSGLALAAGVYFVADGTTGLITALRASERGGYLYQPVISLAIGAVLILWPEGSLRLLLVAFGAWVLFVGVSQLVSARQLSVGDPGRTVMMSMGGILALLGLALALWPGSGLVVISWAVALVALLVGGYLLFFALSLRRLHRGVDIPGG